MFKHFLILASLLVSFPMCCLSQATGGDRELRELVRINGQAEVTIPLSDITSMDSLTRRVSILSVRNDTVLISLSPVTTDWFIKQGFSYSISAIRTRRYFIPTTSVKQAMEWDRYPTFTQYDSIMRSFTTYYPSLCDLDTIGTSINGKLILALKISDNAANDEDEPEVFYTSSMHGDETGGFVLMLRFAEYLLKNYGSDGRIRSLVDNLEIWINPLANPDGTYRNGNTMTNPTRFNANGVDLNRNFPDPFLPGIVQEKENTEMISFMRKHRFVLSANFHSGSEVVNYPWDRWLSMLHADNDWFYRISRSYADTVHKYAGTGYMTDQNNGVTRGAAWYIIYGGRQDFATWELQGREVTIELDREFITPEAQLPLLWSCNYHSLTGYLENALYGIHGRVIDAVTSEPVGARVFIAGHDRDSSHVYSDKSTGSFFRYLSQGSWTITFSAKGYNDQAVNNIYVANRQRTDVVVRMDPSVTKIDSTSPGAPLIYPNPAENFLNILLPDSFSGEVRIKVINMAGTAVRDYIVESVPGTPLQIDIGHFASGIYSVIFTDADTKTSCRGRFVVVK